MDIMIRVILIAVCAVNFTITAFGQERDILDFAAIKPRASQVKNLDGTWRTPKYGDYQLEQAVERLKDYSQPFTVPKVISWYSEAKDEKIRASLLRVLATSRDPRAGLVLGSSLKDDSLDVRVAATYGVLDYFIDIIDNGGTDQHMIQAQEWWEKNRERLEDEANTFLLKSTQNK
jgi:hypothetical protein